MRNRNVYSLAILVLFSFLAVASYVERKFYQSYSTIPENGEVKDNAVVFEDERCKVSYNLWAEGGDIGFVMYNKTPDFISIDPQRLFFVLNGFSYEYGYGKIVVPPKASVKVTEFMVTDKFYNSCDLDEYPSKKDIKTVTFTRETSPFVFYNLIAYNHKGVTHMMENRFYVSEIKNLPKDEMVKETEVTKCGKKTSSKIEVFKEASPTGFYVSYSKVGDDEEEENNE
ncbi:MAG: hypothetical protein K9H26_12140 [Prolixibacteraceae bacterium]|nr:hypothetical protein [Prolixibacteraceae bacterium]